MKFSMNAEVLEEAGYQSAIYGLSLSFNSKSDMTKVAQNLSDKDGGHNKVLESIMLWIDVRAPRYWWQEADTYRISTKQSEATLHTLFKSLDIDKYGVKGVIENNFEQNSCSDEFIKFLCESRNMDKLCRMLEIKRRLPEGFLQRRVWCMSYKTLRNIILQRVNHKLPHWNSFITQVLNQVKHPELLPNPKFNL